MFDLAENDLRVLDLLWQHGSLSRTRLAEMTGLTVPSLSRISQRLISQKLARESSSAREGKRGQPTMLLEINPKAGFTLGVTIAPDSFSLCLMDFHGEIVGEKTVELKGELPLAIAKIVEEHFQCLLGECRISRKKIIGAGISVPGSYKNSPRFFQTIEQMSSWQDVDIQGLFEPLLKMPVRCDNIAKTSAFLEARFGAGRNYNYFVYIHLSHGVGGGIINNRQLLQGLEGNAASFGSLFPRPAHRPSAGDLVSYLQSLGLDVPTVEALSGVSIPDDILQPWLERSASQLSWLTDIVYWTLAPQSIIVGGLIPTPIMKKLLAHIKPSEQMKKVSQFRDLPQVLLAEHNGVGAHRGAATLSLQRLMPSNQIQGN